MSPRPLRRGEPKARLDTDAAMRAVREAEMRGRGPSGEITRAVVALLAWCRRRKEQRRHR